MSGPKRIRKSGRGPDLPPDSRGRHRFEHWYVDRQVYFITARCRDRPRKYRYSTPKAT